MLQRSFTTSAQRACWLGDQRVASRVPRLASKPQPSLSHTAKSTSHLVLVGSSPATEACSSRRSVTQAFGLLAGSTASARTGLRHGRNASTWSGAQRGFATTSAARDLKQDAKDKLVEQGKKMVQQTVGEKVSPQQTDKLAEEGKRMAQHKVDETLASGSGNRLVEEGKRFARDQLNSKLSAEETKQQAKNLSSSTSKILFAALAVAAAAYHFLGGQTHAEEAPTSAPPKYTKDQVSLLCLIGPPLSGKTTQAKRLLEHFSSDLDDIVSPQSIDELKTVLASRSSSKRTSLILDNFPATRQDAERIESELVPIFCFSFYDLPLKDFEKRLPKATGDKERKEKVQEFNRYTEKLQPLVKKYRDQGNIYEISADWESADEVWEQVQAKTEQIMELRARGEL